MARNNTKKGELKQVKENLADLVSHGSETNKRIAIVEGKLTTFETIIDEIHQEVVNHYNEMVTCQTGIKKDINWLKWLVCSVLVVGLIGVLTGIGIAVFQLALD